MLTSEGIAYTQIKIAQADLENLVQMLHQADYGAAQERLPAIIRQLQAANRMLRF